MQFDPETLAVMRSVLDDTCRDIPVNQNQVRTYVATAILDCAKIGERSIDALRYAASVALLEVYANSDLVRAVPSDIEWSR
jgi:hypothetical protein